MEDTSPELFRDDYVTIGGCSPKSRDVVEITNVPAKVLVFMCRHAVQVGGP
jgi:hypothetical protein